MPDTRRIHFEDNLGRANFRAVLAHPGVTPVGKGDQVKIRYPDRGKRD